jgi:hypothetical protein
MDSEFCKIFMSDSSKIPWVCISVMCNQFFSSILRGRSANCMRRKMVSSSSSSAVTEWSFPNRQSLLALGQVPQQVVHPTSHMDSNKTQLQLSLVKRRLQYPTAMHSALLWTDVTLTKGEDGESSVTRITVVKRQQKAEKMTPRASQKYLCHILICKLTGFPSTWTDILINILKVCSFHRSFFTRRPYIRI